MNIDSSHVADFPPSNQPSLPSRQSGRNRQKLVSEVIAEKLNLKDTNSSEGNEANTPLPRCWEDLFIVEIYFCSENLHFYASLANYS